MEYVPAAERETVEAMDGVFLTQLAVGDEMSVQGLRMAPGAVIPEHDHHHEQVGFVYEGEQTFLLEDDVVTVGPGDSYWLEGGEPHGVENRTDGAMRAIDVFSPPRPNPSWLD